MLYVVGKSVWVAADCLPDDGYIDWEIIGIYDSEPLAVQACTTSKHFVGPMQLNETLSDDLLPWPGIYFPIEDTTTP